MDFHPKSNDEYKIRSTDRCDAIGLKTDETIFSLANGRLGVRANFAEGYGTPDPSPVFMNGFYNYYPFHYEENYKQFPQRGQTIVPLPDPTWIEIVSADGPIDMVHGELVSIDRSFDMMDGGTIRTTTYKTRSNHRFTVTEERRIAVKHNVLIQRITVHSVDYEGDLIFKSHLAMPYVAPVASDDPRLSRPKTHLRLMETQAKDDWGMLCAQTTESKLTVCAGITHDIPFSFETEGSGLVGTLKTSISKDQTFALSKFAAYASSNVEANPKEMVRSLLSQPRSIANHAFEEALKNKTFWERSDVTLPNPEWTKAVRYNLYQLDHSGGEDALHSIAAKGISGDGYEGHYFWDTETYMLPFFLFTNPPKARNLLAYRIRHLPKARLEARNLGVQRGAKIPWRTIDGSETSPYYPAGSAQIHINSDVALAAIHYVQATKDEAFLDEGGAELILETAMFLYDWGHYRDGAFHLDTVTGPDEYSALVNDNFYTNRMAKRHFLDGSKLLLDRRDRFNALIERLGYTWDDVHALSLAGHQMAMISDPSRDIWAQDDHFLHKKEWRFDLLPPESFPLLLSHHPLAIYRHQVLKQADTVLAMVLSGDPVDERFAKTVEYYRTRTTHDSSLSKCAYGIAASWMGSDVLTKTYFDDVANLDLIDSKRHTRHGLHLANMGGSYLMVALGLFGIRLGDELAIDPHPFAGWKKGSLRMTFQGVRIHLQLDPSLLRVATDRPIPIWICGRRIVIASPQTFVVKTLTK